MFAAFTWRSSVISTNSIQHHIAEKCWGCNQKKILSQGNTSLFNNNSTKNSLGNAFPAPLGIRGPGQTHIDLPLDHSAPRPCDMWHLGMDQYGSFVPGTLGWKDCAPSLTKAHTIPSRLCTQTLSVSLIIFAATGPHLRRGSKLRFPCRLSGPTRKAMDNAIWSESRNTTGSGGTNRLASGQRTASSLIERH